MSRLRSWSGSALFILVGLQLIISWLVMRVLEELAERDRNVAADLSPPL